MGEQIKQQDSAAGGPGSLASLVTTQAVSKSAAVEQIVAYSVSAT